MHQILRVVADVPHLSSRVMFTVADINALTEYAITLHGCLIAFWLEDRRPDLLSSQQFDA